jgi:nucleotide-binding universal stress UspA family protein
MFQQIMVPLDGSEVAERALPCAERLARLAGATVHLVRVIESPPDPSRMVWVPDMVGAVPTGMYADLVAAETRQATVYLDKMHAQVTAAGLRAQAAPLTGHAAAALLDYERAAGIDLVVMCSHGRSGLARFAFGSVADRLLRHGVAPVLLVRAFGAPVTLEHAVVPLDGSARAEEALRVVDALAHDGLRAVTLLRVIDAPDQGPQAERYLVEVAQRLQPAPLVPQCRVEQGDPAAAIIATAGAAELVVMATHGRSGLTRWALGSVADRVMRGGVAGVLLVRTSGASQHHRPEDSGQHHRPEDGGQRGSVDGVLR